MQNTEEKQQVEIPEPEAPGRDREPGARHHYRQDERPRPRRHGEYYPHDPRHKSTLVATVLSCMPGLGQIYIGYYQHGFVNIIVVASLIALLNAGLGNLQPLAGLFLAFFWLYNVVDAYRRAVLYNQTITGLGPEELPEDIKLPRGRGSLLGGAILLIFGAFALAHTRFGLPMAWVEDWWPLALILIGLYLIAQNFLNKKE